MSSYEEFEWLDANQASERFEQEKTKGPSPETIDMAVIGLSEQLDDEQVLVNREPEPRLLIENYKREVERHLDELWVVGGSKLTDEELRDLGPYLAREETYRESAVFHMLHRRRADVPEYLKPYITVKKRHLLLCGLAAQSGRISLETYQKDQTTAAMNVIKPLMEAEVFEDFFMGSGFQRRVLRALHYVLSEPDNSTQLLLNRYKQQVESDGPLGAKELIDRTYGFTVRQITRHQKEHPNTLETEESLVQLLEEGRLQRLAKLGQRVLATGSVVIASDEYKVSE
jgi:hypothetical protein